MNQHQCQTCSSLDNSLHEECGVIGFFNRGDVDVVGSCYHGLYALQHRGQESCGIAVNYDGKIQGVTGNGLVNEVFNESRIRALPQDGQIAIGHVRYASRSERDSINAQPMIFQQTQGSMAFAHNGTLVNGAALRQELEQMGSIFHTTSDTEAISYMILQERLVQPTIEQALSAAMPRLAGAYSLVLMSPHKLVAARDPKGFRPLCIGRLGNSTVVASESCALGAVGATFERDIDPGEIVVITDDGVTSIRTHCGQETSLCVFEYVYFARPDSVIDGASVHMARKRAGAYLAQEHPVDADVVIGVPDSGLDAALGYAQESGIPYEIGLLKNKYIGRTFIAPTQQQRENDVRIKLNPISATVKGKRVVMVDDSIVRGTTSLKIIKLLRDAGATEIHMRLTCPPFLHPCYFGTDIDSSENLIAYHHTIEEIRQMIDADTLGYLSIDALHRVAEGCPLSFCDGCFTGNYPIEIPKENP